MDFKFYSLNELVKIRYGKNQKKVEDPNGNYPIYGTGGLMGYSDEFLYDKPSVLIGRKGSIDKVKYIDKPFWTVDTLFYTEVNENKVLPKYLYYLMSLLNLSSYNEGTSIPSLRTETLYKIDLNIPPIQYQKQVLKILNAIDSKIEINNKINNNLLGISKVIYRRWFVDYNFPDDNNKPYKINGGKFYQKDMEQIPTNWEIKTLNQISKDIVCGKTPSTKKEEYYSENIDDTKFITIPDMHNNVFVVKTDRYLSEKGKNSQKKKTIPPNSICVSCIATSGLSILTMDYAQTNQQINSIIPKEDVSSYYVYLTMQNMSEYIEMLGSGGSTTNNLNKTQFSKIKILVPEAKILSQFHEIVEPLFMKIKENQIEIENLTKLRDTLLPKLMSGDIDVSDINFDL